MQELPAALADGCRPRESRDAVESDQILPAASSPAIHGRLNAHGTAIETRLEQQPCGATARNHDTDRIQADVRLLRYHLQYVGACGECDAPRAAPLICAPVARVRNRDPVGDRLP